MSNCGSASTTSYDFYTEITANSNNINKVGIFPESKIETVLQCNGNSREWVQFFVPEVVDIPSQKPSIESIGGVHSCVEIISQRVIKTPTVTGYTTPTGVFVPGNTIPNSEGTYLTGRKLVIEGLLKQKIIYTALDSEQSMHSAHFTIPFSVFIIIDGTTSLSKTFSIVPYIEDIYVVQLSDRSIFKNTTIFIKATPTC